MKTIPTTILTRRVRTPDLKSYDETMRLPIEIHFGAGPVPGALAVYDDEGVPLVEYEDLGALCEAHKLDPEIGLDAVRTAELEARTIIVGGPWIYVRSDNDGSEDDTLSLVRLEDPARTLAVEIHLGVPGKNGDLLGVYDLAGSELDPSKMGIPAGKSWELATDAQIIGEEALRVAKLVKGQLCHGLSLDEAEELIKNGGAALLSLEVQAIFDFWATGKTTVTRWAPPGLVSDDARGGGVSVDEAVALILRDCPFWAPELRAEKLGSFILRLGDPLCEALLKLPEKQREMCGADRIVRAMPGASSKSDLVLFCRIGGSAYKPGEKLLWGWGEGSSVENGGEPDEVMEMGEATTEEILAQVEEHAAAPTASGLREVYRKGRGHLVIWDGDNEAWWIAGLCAAREEKGS